MPQFYRTEPVVPQMPNPLETAGNYLALKGAAQQQKLRDQQMKERELLRQISMESGGDFDKMLELGAQRGLSPETLAALQDQAMQRKEKERTAKIQDIELWEKQNEVLGTGALALRSLAEPERGPRYQQIRPIIEEKFGIKLPEEMDLSDGALDFVASSSKTTAERLKALKEEKRTAELHGPKLAGEQADAATKQLALAAQFLSGARSQEEWDSGKLALSLRGFDPELLARIPQQFSPEAVQQLQQMGMSPAQGVAGRSDFEQAFQREKGRQPTLKELIEHKREMAREGRTQVSFGGGLPSRVSPQAAQIGGDAVLQKVDAGTAALVRKIANYELDPARATSMRGGRREQILGLVSLYDPSYDSTQFTSRSRMRQDFNSGKSANNIRSLNTAVGHLETLAKAGKELDNSSFQLWNQVANYGLTQTGDPRVVRFNAAATAVDSELASLFKGTGATDQEINAWREQLNSSQSPQQIQGAIQQVLELMASRLGAIAQQWEAGMGKPKDFRILNQKSRAILQRMGDQEMLTADQISAGGVETSGPAGGKKSAEQEAEEYLRSLGKQ